MAGSSIYGLMRYPEEVRLENPLDMQAKRMQLRQMMGQGELQGLQIQQARQGMADDQGTRDFYSGLQPGEDPRTRIGDLMRVNPKAGMAAQKFYQEADKSGADTSKAKAEALAKNMSTLRDALVGVNDQAGYDAWRDGAARLMGPDIAMKAPPQFDPNWKTQNLMKAEDAIKQIESALGRQVTMRGQDMTSATAQAGQGVTVRGQDLTDRRTRDEGAANRGVTMRGQNLTDARSRETTDAGRVPAGYRRTADGNLESIPGGPAQSREDKTSDTERTSAGYASRMGASGQIIDELEKKGVGKPGWMESAYRGMGAETAANTSQMLYPERQKYRQAQEDWVRAKLRKESGAVIASDEMDREIRVYFPMIGDSKEVVTQKASSRKVAERAMTQAAGRAPVSGPPKAAGGIKFLGFE